MNDVGLIGLGVMGSNLILNIYDNFSKTEFSFFDSNSQVFVNIIEKFIDCGINETMNAYNS